MNAETSEVKDNNEPEEPNGVQEIEIEGEGEAVIDEAPIETEETEEADHASDLAEDVELSDTEQLRIALKEAEEKSIEAERKVHDFAERFRSAQTSLKLEAEEQRKRIQKSFDQKLESSRSDIVSSLLETLDNLKRAIAAADNGAKKEQDFDALLNGLKATATLFESRMLCLGLVAVPAVGEQFNPEFHEAVEIVTVPDDQDNVVIDEFQTGYKFGERLLRPAIVRVGKAQ